MKTNKKTTVVALFAAVILLMTSCALRVNTSKVQLPHEKAQVDSLIKRYGLKQLASFTVKVPADFNVDTALSREPHVKSAIDMFGESYFFGKFGKVTDTLVPGKKYKVVVISVEKTDKNESEIMPSDSVLAFMQLMKAKFIGGPGVLLLRDQYHTKLKQLFRGERWQIAVLASYDMVQNMLPISTNLYTADRSVDTLMLGGTYGDMRVDTKTTQTLHIFPVLENSWSIGTNSYENGLPLDTDSPQAFAFLLFYEIK